MKVITKAKVQEYEIEDQMANEIEIMGTIDHPNIVKLEYYFETRHELTLILEYANNGTLFSKIKERGAHLKTESHPTTKPYLNDQMIARVSHNNSTLSVL
jgi:serine/threonine protein kinase